MLGFPAKLRIGPAVQPFLRRGFRHVVAALLLAGAAATAHGAEYTLSPEGAVLGTIETTGEIDDLRITVDLAGDVADSTHAWALIGGSELRQRTANGYWVPWSGDTDDLVDNNFATHDGRIVFKLIDGPLGDDNRGISLAVGYRTGGTLKYGVLGLVPAVGGGS